MNPLLRAIVKCEAKFSDPWTAPHEDDDSGLQLLADQAVLHDVTPKESESSCQQAPTRVSLLTRPETSGDDPGAGFSFTKAQPLQKLDFTRGPKQNTTVPSNGEAISSSHDTASNIHSRVSPAVSENTKSAEFLDTAPSKRIDIRVQPRIPLLSSPLTEGSTVADPVDFRPHNHLSTKSMSKPVLEDPPLKASENGISKTPDYTLVDPEFCGPNTTRETGLLSNKYKTDAVKPVSDYVAAQVTNNGEFQAADHSKSIKTFSREPHTFGTAAPKVTKIRRRKTAAGPVGNEAPRFVNNNTWTEDNIMDFLSYKVKQGRQEREQIKCAYEAKEVEIHRLRQAIDSLYTQLQEMDKRHSEKTSELSKIKAAKPGWESKIKKLTDYVKGLTNDHNRLRDDAKDLQEQQGSISDDYQDLKDSLKEAHRAIKHERGASKQVIGEARRELEQLGCTIRLQRKQLESDETLLLAEHKRSDRLEDQISSFSANHGQLLELFASHRESMFAKIDDLVIKTLDVHPLSNTGPQDDVRPMLAECLKLVQHLHAAENLRPADLEKLGVSMDSCIARYALPQFT